MHNLDLFGFLTLGLFTGFGHCLAMCHPFVLYISGRFVGNRKGYWSYLSPHLLYNLGRIITYGLLGLVPGLLGKLGDKGGSFVGIRKLSSILAGCFLLIYGIFSLIQHNPLRKIENRFAKNQSLKLIEKFQPGNPLILGLILGFLPCGMIYNALVASIALGSPALSSLAMALFGIGTMTALIFFSLFGNFIMKRKKTFNILSLILIIVMGIRFIYMGIASHH